VKQTCMSVLQAALIMYVQYVHSIFWCPACDSVRSPCVCACALSVSPPSPRCHFNLPSVEAEEETHSKLPPIKVKFEIPYFTVSGMQVSHTAGAGCGQQHCRQCTKLVEYPGQYGCTADILRCGGGSNWARDVSRVHDCCISLDAAC
jgi:hypothetical protein